MDMVKAAGGAVMEDEYPYIGQNGYCKNNATTKAAYFSGYQDIPEGDEQALMEALATHGPLYVALDASESCDRRWGGGWDGWCPECRES